ncbi:DNA repair protein RadC [uncultured Cetobacterium sp.]|uniref:RadC family protein n=1 Tax=uncultured Cetobacterium sp. TaxID=527638 RepID=UPI00261E8112|nr:DNA repair protein RadC [uncultured Cetobacterium sp.]
MEKDQMLGHRKRLREKYLKTGYKGFEDYEILELILTYSIKLRDCKSIAKDLLGRFKTIEKVLKAEVNDLQKIDGIGKETAIYLKVIGDVTLNQYYKNIHKMNITSLKGKSELINYLKGDVGFLKSEEFKVIYLSSDNKIVCDEILFKGTIDRSVVYPRKIMERAIDNRAKGIIFAHNHPSGNLTPSKKDIELTLEMQSILEKVDIKLLDHIIVSEESHFSFYENGLIEYY